MVEIVPVRTEVIIISTVLILIGYAHVVYPKRLADFYTNHWRGKASVEELQRNQHVRTVFTKNLGFVIMFIGILIGLIEFRII